MRHAEQYSKFSKQCSLTGLPQARKSTRHLGDDSAHQKTFSNMQPHKRRHNSQLLPLRVLDSVSSRVSNHLGDINRVPLKIKELQYKYCKNIEKLYVLITKMVCSVLHHY